MYFRIQLFSDKGYLVYEEKHPIRIQAGMDLEVDFSQPIVRYTMTGIHTITGYKISFKDHIEERNLE